MNHVIRSIRDLCAGLKLSEHSKPRRYRRPKLQGAISRKDYPARTWLEPCNIFASQDLNQAIILDLPANPAYLLIRYDNSLYIVRVMFNSYTNKLRASKKLYCAIRTDGSRDSTMHDGPIDLQSTPRPNLQITIGRFKDAIPLSRTRRSLLYNWRVNNESPPVLDPEHAEIGNPVVDAERANGCAAVAPNK
jgi:hypothetical protein